ncbi:MAG: hypothetical protein KAG96_07225 [Ichthyobacteriaceae bacterium]|nr:hypothetical protein [Ichthyobacteriaceae bacterium]
MKIAILYICTGKYDVFWDGFYNSSEEFFVNGDEKHYFVFTDSNNIIERDNVTIIKKQSKGFPADSLYRFDMFLEIEKQVLNYNYVFFFNSNMLFVDYVGTEIFPCNNFKGLIGVIHPLGLKYKNNPSMFTYERNKNSTAYIKKESEKKYEYFMGGLNGGSVSEYYKMVSTCSKNTHIDDENGIVAVYHDESHLNKYFSENKVHSLPTSYGFPEGWNLPFNAKIIIRDKVKVDKYFDKNNSESKLSIYLKLIIQMYKAIIW